MRRAKVEWRCRRGMRELDLVLQQFLVSQYDALGAEDQAIFAELLEYPDQDILAWVTMTRKTPNDRFTNVIERIREANQ